MEVSLDLSVLMSIAALTFGFLATIAAFGGHAIRPGGRFWQLTRRGYVSLSCLFLALTAGVVNEIIVAAETRRLTAINESLLAQMAETVDRTESIAAAVDRPRAQLSPGLTEAHIVMWNAGLDPVTEVRVENFVLVRARSRLIADDAEGDPFAPQAPSDPSRIIQMDPFEFSIRNNIRTADFSLSQRLLTPFQRTLTDAAIAYDRHTLERYVSAVRNAVEQRVNGIAEPIPRPGMSYALQVEAVACLKVSGRDRFDGEYTATGVFGVRSDGDPRTRLIDPSDYKYEDCLIDHNAALPAALPTEVSSGDETVDLETRIGIHVRRIEPQLLELPDQPPPNLGDIVKFPDDG